MLTASVNLGSRFDKNTSCFQITPNGDDVKRRISKTSTSHIGTVDDHAFERRQFSDSQSSEHSSEIFGHLSSLPISVIVPHSKAALGWSSSLHFMLQMALAQDRRF